LKSCSQAKVRSTTQRARPPGAVLGCRYLWNGFTYDHCCAWSRTLTWKGAVLFVSANVERGVVRAFSLGKVGPVSRTVAPSRAEKRSIIAVIRADFCGPGSCDVRVTGVRLSGTNRSYGAADVWDPGVGGADVIVRRVNGRWKVVAGGTDDVGCGIVPRKVLNDLRLYCP
jgi:hypothetical protein